MKKVQVSIAVPKVLLDAKDQGRSAWDIYKRTAKQHWQHKDGPFTKSTLYVGCGLAFVGAGIGGYTQARQRESYDRKTDIKIGMALGSLAGVVSAVVWPVLPFVIPTWLVYKALYKGLVACKH